MKEKKRLLPPGGAVAELSFYQFSKFCRPASDITVALLHGREAGKMAIDRILSDYRNGDKDKRIILFLAYRDLREEFSCIEQDEDALQIPEKGCLKWPRW